METANPSLSVLSREEKLSLLRRLDGSGAPPEARPMAEPQREDERPDGRREYPASVAQRRLWFLERLEPGAGHNNIFRAVRVVGPLDREALGRAVAGLARRHDAFRTRFAEAEGEPVQVVEPASRVASPLRSVALAGLDPEAREGALQALARSEAAAPFDLARAPLARFTLVELGAEEAALLVTIHHAVADGWSLAIVFRELSELYRAEAEGVPGGLPAAPVIYGEHARGQRERLSGDGLAAELAHWKAELAGAPEVLDLPTDRPRPALATFRGGVVPFELPAEATEALRRLAREERTTPFAALLAAFAAVLGRWSGQDDLLLGVPVAGRPEPELEGIVGFFANTLVVRAELHGRPTFRELLRRARARTLAALAHQEVPFEHLVEELRPRRDLSRNPLYQAMFALQTMPRAALSLGQARAEPLAVERGLAKVDLTLDLAERDGRLLGYLEHNLDLFDRTTATRQAAHVRRLSEAAAANPDGPLDEVELLTPAERHLLLHEAQGPAQALPAGETVDALIRRRAAADPDRPAVRSAAGSWTYGQLRRAAGRVARELGARGIGAGDRVAIRAGRSREAVAAFLGVLEAGCAYVPLDPEYPEERLAFMLRDSGARALLSGPVPEAAREITGALAAAAGEGIALLDLDADRLADAGGPEPPAETPARRHPAQAAYVLYTSGTTGRPKGVVISHRALLNHALAAAEAYELGPGDRVLQFASTSFDIAGEEIYPSLLAGASLTLRPEGVTPSPAELAAFVAEHRLSVVNVPTPLWHEWVAELAEGHAAPPPCLRLVVVGTEGALPEPLARWRAALERLGHPDRPRWVNAYGPTEGTITATAYGPARGEGERLARVPVGRPLANVRAHVLDRGFRPAPLGVPGELCLGGPGLAWGYLGRPAATAAAFVPDSLIDPAGPAGAPGSRLYRTGDRARRRTDGEIEFLGRTDHQVKVRGFRIELGEIEAVLAAHPGVREAVVEAREAGPGDRRLVAYAVEEGPGGAPPEALREHLAGRLPAYMVPSAFVHLSRLPLTPAGKVDRRALPEPEWAARGAGFAPPRGPVEELLAGIWAEVLGREEVGARDDFFDLGGHSLLAARVVARIRDRMGVEVPLRRLFEARTVEALARDVAALRQGGGLAAPPPIRRRGRRGELPASFAQ
ncbi:MAG TPA: amino acid adenylation domain-containing protein, partial [Thermoanaerobaculia bacterium]|nr:amino acid adenylation domain-containing protein [Thermoanaerobaculia bacterium]